MAKVIVIVRENETDEPKWWTAEGDPFSHEPLKIIEPFPEELKSAWKETFIEFMNSCAPWLLFFDEKGRETGTGLNGREIVYPDN